MGGERHAVDRLVPFAHVADVERAAGFYAHLGFRVKNAMRDHGGRMFWIFLESGRAELMLAQASGPIRPEDQAVLFYMYSDDVAALRKRLLASGLRDGGAYRGSPGDGCAVVFEATYPDYMKGGEIRVHDLDGYCILIGQND